MTDNCNPQVWQIVGNETTSYHPISLVCILSKMWERVRLELSISETNLIPKQQFEFHKHHSTVKQVQRVYQSNNP